MATIGYAGWPIPGAGDSPTGPGELAAIATAIDPHLVQHVADEADRTATLSGAAVWTVAIAADGTTWVKTDADTDTWATTWAPLPAWRTLTLAAGMEAGQTTPQVMLIGQQVFLRGRVQKIDSSSLGLAGVLVATVPDDCIPAQLGSYPGGQSLSGDPVVGAGRVDILSPDEDGSSLGGRGSVIWYTQDTGTGTNGPTWVDLSGDYWKN